MRCEDVRPLVEDYFDGELDEQTNDLMAQHVGLCAACASLYQKLEGEQELYLRYECEAQPAPAFWENVMARAAEERVTHSSGPLSRLQGWFNGLLGGFTAPRFSPSLTALIVLVAIAITIGVMRYNNSPQIADNRASSYRNEGSPTQVFSTQPDEIAREALPSKDDAAAVQKSEPDEGGQPPSVKNSAGRKTRPLLAASKGNNVRVNLKASTAERQPISADELVREAEQKYVEAIALLSRDVNRRRSRLDPQTTARFERTLAAVNRTIADTRRAVRKHPGDPVATQYMLTAYARKVDVLREMASY
jgi:hypothetical protein